MGLTSWADRAAQVEATGSRVQDGHHAIAEAVIEKRTKPSVPACPHRVTKVTMTPVAACDIKEWKQVVEQDGPEKGTRKGNAANRPE